MPLAFLWVFPWKTRRGNLCDNIYSLDEIMLVFFCNIPITASCLSIGVVLIKLWKIL